MKTGTAFAGYRVESLVGRGGMGVVYRATDLSLERPVALKLIAPELAEDERFRGRFLREPRLAASLDHPNVIPIYEAGERDGQLYLAMRFVEGSDLKGDGPGGNRPLRRDPGSGAPAAAGEPREGRHPGHLPLRRQRGHHARQATVLRVMGRSAADERLPTVYQGATVDRVIEVPTGPAD
jgi:hypothetical protein